MAAIKQLFFLLLLFSFPSRFLAQSRADTSLPQLTEATIATIQLAFANNTLTSKQLVQFYINRIQKYNSLLRGVIELNPDALSLAERADRERQGKLPGSGAGLHGIPVLLKDNIATKDKLNTTAGSFALLGSIVPRDAGVVKKLRAAGAIILGKASLSEWSNFRSSSAPNGFCGRTGIGKNTYVLSADPCGSSSGPAISMAANFATVSLGSETDGSILCPSSSNSVVGIKPTVGLTSRAGVIPISPRQDTIGTVADAAHVLDTITGFDRNDPATKAAAKYIPRGGYKQFLKQKGLKGKRLGIVRNPFFQFSKEDSDLATAFHKHLNTLTKKGAILVDPVEISNVTDVLGANSGEMYALLAEFKPALNSYLKGLVSSKVRSLGDVIAFNKKFPALEKTKEYGQDLLETSEGLNGSKDELKAVLLNLKRLSEIGIEKVMKEQKLDALVSGEVSLRTVLAIGGYPGITVPAGYDGKGVPFGIFFGGLKGSEPKLIEIGYGFEQATMIRKPPSFKP
ncbi:Probable amidase At4g34880 [Linum perenne]